MWNLLLRWGHPQSCFCYCYSYGSHENGGWKIGSAAYHGPQTVGWPCILHIPRVLSLAGVKILNCEQKIARARAHTHTHTHAHAHAHAHIYIWHKLGIQNVSPVPYPKTSVPIMSVLSRMW